MNQDDRNALSIDEIMHNVAKEVAHRAKHQLDQTADSLRPQVVITFTQKNSYHRNEFIVYEDLQFVENAFLGILKRPADETGLSDYVHFLRNGGEKEFVLLDLQESGEAKNRSVVIKGLRLHRMRNWIRKLFPHSKPITRIIHKLDIIFLAPWFRLSSSLRHKFNAQKAVHHDADAMGHVLHNQFQTHAQQLELQAQQIKQLSTQVRANQSELIISRSHTHSLLSLLETVPSHNDAQQKSLSQFTSQHKLDAFYLAFEDACRGTNEETSAKLQPYLPYVQKVVDEFGSKASAVDLGCGRGEWLQILYPFPIAAQGIDLNKVMVDYCLTNDHQVEQGDALIWMQRQASQSQHLVSSFHVLEHIPFKEYYLWFEQFSRILAPGGILILETPNPENLLVASHTFYHDPTHLNPITPALLEFTAKFFGLQVLAIKRLNPYPESAKVKGHDELTERVNGHLCGPQDFALIAIKPIV